MPKESAARPFYTLLVLALVCSLLVSGAAVGLRERQDANRQLDRQKNILRAAGLYSPDTPVAQAFKQVERRVVDLRSGRYVDLAAHPELEDFDARRAVRDPALSRELTRAENIAGLSRLERYANVYLVHQNGRLTQVVLPIRGKGLWSTMYAYVALDADMNTIRGIAFYEHGETPGLGGEIENPSWQAGWIGKRIYDKARQVVLRVVKGRVPEGEARKEYRVDGISGATLTGKGVNNLLRFWFGEHGFGPFVERHRGAAAGGGEI